MANYTQRPLYTVNCGDFGYEPKLVEKNFLEILELAASWNAIIMIDEADVFLEQRSTRDIVRNALVSGLRPPTFIPFNWNCPDKSQSSSAS